MKGTRKMTSIKVMMTEERKKHLKMICLENDKTITQYVLECLDKVCPLDREALQKELTAVEEQLSRYGGKLSYDERTALKIRRSELRKELGR